MEWNVKGDQVWRGIESHSLLPVLLSCDVIVLPSLERMGAMSVVSQMISFFRVVNIFNASSDSDKTNESCTLAYTLFSSVAKIYRAVGAGTELKLLTRGACSGTAPLKMNAE